MALEPQWRARIDLWLDAIKQFHYAKLGPVPLETTFTFDQLTLDQARQLSFAPITSGEKWGRKWEYAWFRGCVVLPPHSANERIVLRMGEPTAQFGTDPYGEWRVFVNDREIGSRDWAHSDLLLTANGSPGTHYDIFAEAFGGPTRAGAGGGPALEGCPTIPEPPDKQREMVDVSYGIWREEVFQLWMDVRTLLELRDLLDPNSLRLAEVDAGLRDFTLLADPELPWKEMQPTIALARDRLRPLLECRNGSTAPLLYCVGHSHLDVVYQWPLKETERKVARTFSNQLGLLQEYPEYRYLQSMPVLYDIAKRLHPEIYHRVQEAVARGQWIAEGGMWTEADLNIPGGESLIRQFIYGKRFFKEEFGVTSILAWLPDVFGYSGAMPQIMRGCGMQYFGSSKILHLFNGGDPFPYTTFWWEGIDGTRIFSHCPQFYGVTTNPKSMAAQWNDRSQKEGIRSRMVAYGHSDGGGGAERTHLEFLRRQEDLEGLPRTRHASPLDFFSDQEKECQHLPVYTGEIYYALCRGTYTTQAKLKRGNRLCEFALRDAEMWAAVSLAMHKTTYPAAKLESVWKKVLFNQFHDILPGSCIERAAQEAEALYDEAFQEANEIAQNALASLCVSRDGNFTAFNSLSWPRTELVAVALAGADTQKIGDQIFAEVTVPGCGWAPVTATASQRENNSSEVIATARSLENEYLRIELNDFGEIIHCFDKQVGGELAVGPMNAFRMYRDTPRFCDAWEIDSHYVSQPIPLLDEASLEVIAQGPLAGVLRLRRKLHCSELEQEIWLRRGSRRIDFRTRIRWNEKHKLLKVCFPTSIFAHDAFHEIQFGYLKRPTHRSRQIDQDRFEVCQQKWSALAESGRGIALLNDCKYGLDALGNSLNLTLLRAPQAPDLHADLGEHEFIYSFYSWNGPFLTSNLTREAYQLNIPFRFMKGFIKEDSLINIDAQNVIIDTIKTAEDGSGDFILRCYESAGTETRCRLHTSLGFLHAEETDMLEQVQHRYVNDNGDNKSIALVFRAFEIKTLRLVRASFL